MYTANKKEQLTEFDRVIAEEINERRRRGNWNPKSKDPPRKPSANWKKTQQGWASNGNPRYRESRVIKFLTCSNGIPQRKNGTLHTA